MNRNRGEGREGVGRDWPKNKFFFSSFGALFGFRRPVPSQGSRALSVDFLLPGTPAPPEAYRPVGHRPLGPGSEGGCMWEVASGLR